MGVSGSLLSTRTIPDPIPSPGTPSGGSKPETGQDISKHRGSPRHSGSQGNRLGEGPVPWVSVREDTGHQPR